MQTLCLSRPAFSAALRHRSPIQFMQHHYARRAQRRARLGV